MVIQESNFGANILERLCEKFTGIFGCYSFMLKPGRSFLNHGSLLSSLASAPV